MALDIRQYTDLIYELQNEVDPETGCKHNSGYEECRQSYFLKQQNEILQQNTASSQLNDDTAINPELEQLRELLYQQDQEITLLKAELEANAPQQESSWLDPCFWIGWAVALLVAIVSIIAWNRRRA